MLVKVAKYDTLNIEVAPSEDMHPFLRITWHHFNSIKPQLIDVFPDLRRTRTENQSSTYSNEAILTNNLCFPRQSIFSISEMAKAAGAVSRPSWHSNTLTAHDANDSVESTQLTHFHYFPYLPKELRQLIFEACLPRRVFRFTYEQLDSPRKSTWHVSEKPSALPWIAFVCKDAYEISRLSRYRLEHRMDFTNILSTPCQWRQRICGTTKIRFNWKLDTLLVNYSGMTPDDDADEDVLDHETYLQGLTDGPYALATKPEVNIVLDMEYLVGPRRNDSISETRWLTSRPYYDCLTQRSHCTVKLATTVISTTSQEIRSSGLFGMFGEERSILIDINDTAKLDRYENYIDQLESRTGQVLSHGWNYLPEGAPRDHPLAGIGAGRYGTRYGSDERAVLDDWRFQGDDDSDGNDSSNDEEDEARRRVFRSVAEKDRAIALTLIMQAWLEAHGCFEPANDPLLPWTGDAHFRKWDNNHHVAKHWLSKLPKFSFVVMYMATEE